MVMMSIIMIKIVMMMRTINPAVFQIFEDDEHCIEHGEEGEEVLQTFGTHEDEEHYNGNN